MYKKGLLFDSEGEPLKSHYIYRKIHNSWSWSQLGHQGCSPRPTKSRTCPAPPREIDKTRGAQQGKTDCRFQTSPDSIDGPFSNYKSRKIFSFDFVYRLWLSCSPMTFLKWKDIMFSFIKTSYCTTNISIYALLLNFWIIRFTRFFTLPHPVPPRGFSPSPRPASLEKARPCPSLVCTAKTRGRGWQWNGQSISQMKSDSSKGERDFFKNAKNKRAVKNRGRARSVTPQRRWRSRPPLRLGRQADQPKLRTPPLQNINMKTASSSTFWKFQKEKRPAPFTDGIRKQKFDKLISCNNLVFIEPASVDAAASTAIKVER